MRARTLLTATLILGVSVGAWAQGPPIPQPGPEHEVLERDVGVWDGTIEMAPPGMPPMTMSGTETSTLIGGRWLVSDWESDMMGQLFQVHTITGWDAAKKAYVSVSVSTMATELSHSESSFDAETESLTGWMEMQDPMGGTSKAKVVEEWPEDGTRVVRVYQPMNASEPFMTMTFTKRK
jgi:hypothetical protein